MNDSTSVELEASEPPNQPPDKFKVPLPKGKSAFEPVVKTNRSGNVSVTNNYILEKTLRRPADITNNEKMILCNHPVIAELIKQTFDRKDTSRFRYYIPVEVLINYQYYHQAKIPILYDSREKWSLEQEVVQYKPLHDEEANSDSTKGYSDYNLMLDEDDQKTIGKYTLRERRERIKKYKLKLQKYKLGLSKNSNKYHQRSIIAKSRPRVRGKFAKTSPSAEVADH